MRIDDDKSIDPSDIVEYVRATIESLTRDVAEVIGDLALIPLIPLVTPIAATG